ncbi:MAG TPA: DedA family protein [Longilinea sp.]|nr:DedA family protein [Longilinea sp.]
MDTLTQWALTNVSLYGAAILIFIAYIGSLGIPFPITMVIVAAGALTRTGLLDWRLAVLACLLGATLADNSEYLLGRIALPWIKQKMGENTLWQQAQSTLDRQGGWAILLTRFWLTPLAPAVNVIAANRYPFWKFLLIDVVGQFCWVLLYGGLGYLFAAQWEWVSTVLGAFSWISVVIVVLAYGIYFWMQRRKNHRASLRMEVYAKNH